MSDSAALAYVARWFTYEMVGNEVGLQGFDPPEEFVALVVRRMVGDQNRLGWPDEEAARGFLAELWPDWKHGAVKP